MKNPINLIPKGIIMKWTKVFLAVALFFALSTMGEARGNHKYYNSYNQGYNDGCYSAKYRGIAKNHRAYRHSSRYHNGWNRGYRDCKRRYNRYNNHRKYNYYNNHRKYNRYRR